MKVRSIQDTLKLTRYLINKNIHCFYEYTGHDFIIVSVFLVLHRIDIRLFADRAEFVVYSGTESVETDAQGLLDLILQHKQPDAPLAPQDMARSLSGTRTDALCLSNLIAFLDLLHRRSCRYHFNQARANSVLITLTLGMRKIEIDFFETEIWYSVFYAEHGISNDQRAAFDLIDWFLREE
jgi:hypothetical protein